MKCPACNCVDSRVLETRSSNQEYIDKQRKHECLGCGKIYFTSIITPENLRSVLDNIEKLPINKFS